MRNKIYEFDQKFMKIIIKYLILLVSPSVNIYLKKNNIFILYRFGNAIGDQVCMSAIAKALYDQKGFKVIIFASYSEIFYNNPYIWKNIDIKEYSAFTQKIIVNLLKFLTSKYIEKFAFKLQSNQIFEDYMRDSKSKISLIEAHSIDFKITLDLIDAKPDVFFTPDEVTRYDKKFKSLKHYAIIQPEGKTTYTPNKEWGFDKYQEVVNKTKDKIKWVQVGLNNDKLLDNIVDFRGKTKSLRELAYVIKNANFVLANEGLLNHISASVNTKSFVVFSGFSQIELAKYKTTIPIVKQPQIECAPCWLLDECPKDRKYCTEDITSNFVIDTIKENI